MIFTTYSYALLLGLTFAVHWLMPARMRPWLLIGVSYFFYATWRWPYLGLLLLVTLFNWTYARKVLHRGDEAPGPLWPGITVNLAVLAYFKYTNFALENLAGLAALFGSQVMTATPAKLDIVLPLGISFFTFQGIAYLVDVASGEAPFLQLRDFMLYKAFWPQLIAGPIIRPGEIREQLLEPRTLRYADVSNGVQRIIQGAFKKLVLADSLATQVDLAFPVQGVPNLFDTLAGVLGFGLQIYFDFSAYSDFAIGSARLFGFRFPENFDWPYLARSPQEFWSRWHMTLTRWIRDYVFTPLSFATRGRPALRLLWLVVAMALCGLWHGAAWTFIGWGVWHGIFLAAQQTWLRGVFSSKSRWASVAGWLITMLVVFFGWLLFRAPSTASLLVHLETLRTLRGGLKPALIRENGLLVVASIAALSASVWLYKAHVEPRRPSWLSWPKLEPWMRPAFYACLLAFAVVMDREATAFVYFQF